MNYTCLWLVTKTLSRKERETLCLTMPSDAKFFIVLVVGELNVIVERWWNITDRKTEVIGENLVPL